MDSREESISTQAELAALKEELRKVSTILLVAFTDEIQESVRAKRAEEQLRLEKHERQQSGCSCSSANQKLNSSQRCLESEVYLETASKLCE
jgi:hypothetical protein